MTARSGRASPNALDLLEYMSSLGTDVWRAPGNTSRGFRWVDGRTGLVLSLLRGLRQPRGKLPYWKGWGENISALVGSNTPLSEIQRRVERQLRRSERVKDAQVIATDNGDGSLSITCAVTDEDGPFPFVLSATQASLTLVSIQGKNA